MTLPTQAPNPRLAERLRRALEGQGIGASQGRALCWNDDAPADAPAGWYRIALEDSRLSLTAGDDDGFHSAVATLLQILRLCKDTPLPSFVITDWPDFRHRGAMLDVSRDKVPTLETLLRLVELLGSLKYNQLQLYIEHTFAYRGHQVVHQNASPLTPEEIITLDQACLDLGIELVPNQNSFGHFHRWLIHEPYRRLAECPEGIEHPFSETREPYGLCASDPAALELLADLYDQLLPCFSSRQFNVGLDETFDLGQGRSKALCQAKGQGEVYLDFLCAVHRLVSERGRRMQFWGDVILLRPDLIERLPKDAVALIWGYEENHPFAEQARAVAASGRAFYLCPGTSSWNSLLGRTDNALKNIASAAGEGLAHGASGLLITDWGDRGHLQPLSVSYLGLFAGAAAAWNAAESLTHRDAIAALDDWAFRDATHNLAHAATELGNAYKVCGHPLFNGSSLFYLLLDGDKPMSHRRFSGLTADGLNAARALVDEQLERLAATDCADDETMRTQRELSWAAQLIAVACQIGLARLEQPEHELAELPKSTRAQLARRLAPLVTEHEAIWLLRNRSGGRADSVKRLERTLAQLRR